MRILSFLILIALILFGISFATLNADNVTINYYVGQKTLPVSLLVVTVFAIGGLLGMAVCFWVALKLKLKNYRLRQRLKVSEKEIENLRAIPVQDRH